MKNKISWIFLFSFCLFTFSCKTQEKIEDVNTDEEMRILGNADVQLNGENVEFVSVGYYEEHQNSNNENTIVLLFDKQVNNFTDYKITVRRIPYKIGTTILHPHNPQISLKESEPYAFMTDLGQNGHVLHNTYSTVDETLTLNSLTIDTIDESTNEVWGRFDMVLVRDTSLPADFTFPDTIHFSEGTFYSILY